MKHFSSYLKNCCDVESILYKPETTGKFYFGNVRNLKTPIFFLFGSSYCNVFKQKKYQKPPASNPPLDIYM